MFFTDLCKSYSSFLTCCSLLRHHDCFDRPSLANAIRQAYTFSDTQKPPTVVHWDTLANLSDFLAPYTKDFAKNCMSFRHLRFFRAKADDKVWLQVASRMDNYGDPTDEWRGLMPLSTHTICYKTSYGIPNLWRSFQRHDLPDAKTRPLDEDAHDKLKKGLHDIHRFFTNFTDANLEDCLAMLELYSSPGKLFPWTTEDMELLYKEGPGANAGAQVGDQQAQGLPVGKVGEVYMCRLEVLHSRGPFFGIGIIRNITRDRDQGAGVNMQWFVTKPDADAFTGQFTSEMSVNTRSTYSSRSFVSLSLSPS